MASQFDKLLASYELLAGKAAAEIAIADKLRKQINSLTRKHEREIESYDLLLQDARRELAGAKQRLEKELRYSEKMAAEVGALRNLKVREVIYERVPGAGLKLIDTKDTPEAAH